MWQDVRYSLRSLGKHPGFLAASVIVLAIGLGLNTAIFTAINAILFRPLPVRAPDELRYIYTISGLNLNRLPVGSLSYRHFLELREQRELFADVLLFATHRERYRIGGIADRAQGESVSANYFELLGVAPIVGRGFGWAEDEAPNAPRVAVISYDLWQSRFLGASDVVGKTIDLSSDNALGAYAPWRPYTIVGVMPRGFHGLSNPWDSTQYWVPFLQRASETVEAYRRDPRRSNGSLVPADLGGLPVARLAPGISTAQAAARVSAFGERLPANARPLADGIGELLYPRRVAVAILGIAGLVGLVLASTGLYGVITYAVAQRVQEIGVRMALGADRRDIVLLIVREGTSVLVVGLAVGFVAAFAAIKLTARVVVALPAVDVATFCSVPLLLASVILIACYIPALRAARTDPMSVLRGL